MQWKHLQIAIVLSLFHFKNSYKKNSCSLAANYSVGFGFISNCIVGSWFQTFAHVTHQMEGFTVLVILQIYLAEMFLRMSPLKKQTRKKKKTFDKIFEDILEIFYMNEPVGSSSRCEVRYFGAAQNFGQSLCSKIPDVTPSARILGLQQLLPSVVRTKK